MTKICDYKFVTTILWLPFCDQNFVIRLLWLKKLLWLSYSDSGNSYSSNSDSGISDSSNSDSSNMIYIIF